MTYRDEKETLRRRVQELEEALDAASSEEDAAAAALAQRLEDANDKIAQLEEALRETRRPARREESASDDPSDTGSLEGVTFKLMGVAIAVVVGIGVLVWARAHHALGAVAAVAVTAAVLYAREHYMRKRAAGARDEPPESESETI